MLDPPEPIPLAFRHHVALLAAAGTRTGTGVTDLVSRDEAPASQRSAGLGSGTGLPFLVSRVGWAREKGWDSLIETFVVAYLPKTRQRLGFVIIASGSIRM